MGVKIFADSASDMPLSFFQENQVTLIPLRVYIDETEYEDLQTINPKQVFKEIRAGKMPKTSQPTPQVFQEVFTELAKSNQSGIYIAFSSALSGTYQTAVMVHEQVKEEYPNLDLTIIDTKCASVGFGLVVKSAAEMAANGASKEEIIDDIHFRSQHMEHLFTVEDLDYLAKGGRLSKASAFLGGLLNIKPLLHVEEGKLIPIEKIRGKKKLLKRILDVMEERGIDLEHQVVGISHGDDEEAALEMKAMIQERFGTKDFYINIIGSAVGSHAGPGTLALFFLNAKK
ncbi:MULTISPECIES: DegV family protein [Heyndrickxia]|jgi:DegV family protein with EDD domain|uniref:DegV family protein n=1 Tax=Heyndrickxia TaxID=2837504 RepID=UPI0003A69F1C|nr:DegV family protein [Heyndrickxia oleronia]MCI1593187.1 DegV family protein [Heyndrickxia oleronia]MCI1611253.1 DegV family protein [Heyndrickxia oleronia]MCI1742695.1 DegV family protein [Heyndrickxia oleronia]MCI1762535.1 DegV family protein [Heyndrickxia oleronia]MCM3238052.1 DegV family protein [Heyndrickxia oleronia]